MQSVGPDGKPEIDSMEEESEDSDQNYGDNDGDNTIDEMGELPSHAEMKKELINAIEAAMRENQDREEENRRLQHEIMLQNPNFESGEKQHDVNLNEHKYLNTLANVHQVRFNLKVTQERYNKLASELQAKLNDKQNKCHEIQKQFKELKRSVAKTAVIPRTMQPLDPKIIDEWEQKEAAKDQELHQYRFQSISMRNQLANKEKILKKKEQLADGLHLIDFEQLKIENSTLNEKIEERNEELHKLRKKVTTTVITLSHTREKEQYVTKQNQQLREENEVLDDDLKKVKSVLTNSKRKREQNRKKK